MSLFDAVIVGSGPAGVAAAYELSGRNICMVDVGKSPSDTNWGSGSNFYQLRRYSERYWNEFVGSRFESFRNIDQAYVPPKLKSPLHRFITEDSAVSAAVESDTFRAIVSFAQGGLANAWGAQLYRYNETDLRQFPLEARVLEPYYDRLTDHVGISGSCDDLARFYGTEAGLLPALRLSELAAHLLRNYDRHRTFFNRHGVFLGRPRLGVLSQPYRGRPACDYGNLEFYRLLPHIYTPRITLEELIRNGRLDYRPGYFVISFEDDKSGARVVMRNIATGQVETIAGKRVLLAAGTIGSAAILLRTLGDTSLRLPIMENLPSYIPFINPGFLGKAHETAAYYTQLNVCYLPHRINSQANGDMIMGTFYGMHGLFHSEFVRDLPLPLSLNVKLLRYILPSMLVLHIWRPGHQRPDNYLTIDSKGTLHIQYTDAADSAVERHLIRVFRRAGYLSAAFLCKYPEPGASAHYAGSLPMRKTPSKKYETHPNGRLHSMKNVYVADGSVFPALPAKNLSFTIMANAMRVAAGLFQNSDRCAS